LKLLEFLFNLLDPQKGHGTDEKECISSDRDMFLFSIQFDVFHGLNAQVPCHGAIYFPRLGR
jgi:hypothetical protein